MSKYGHYEPIAREALPFLIPVLLAAFVFWRIDLNWLSLVLILAALYIAWFFRNPERIFQGPEESILSPADGKVVEILENAAPTLLEKEGRRRVSVFMSIFNVHVNRAPLSGEVKAIQYFPGKFLDARDPLSSTQNERSHMVISNGDMSIEVVQIAGLVARRIANWAAPGDQLQRGVRYGLIRFGSRLDIYLPDDVKIMVAPGDKVKAGLSVIGLSKVKNAKGS